MILPHLTRHIAVCSLGEVQRFLDLDRDFWNVISIRDTTRRKLLLPRAQSVLPLYFDDAEIVEDGSRWIVMSPDQAQEIWRFVNCTGQGPLLIHCVAGLSRSTAVAAAVIAHGLLAAGLPPANVANQTVEHLLAIRPQACPNSLVLLRILEMAVEPRLARDLTRAVWEDDRIMHNRFVRPH